VLLRILTSRITAIELNSSRICSASRIGVIPICLLNLGPLTKSAGYQNGLLDHEPVEQTAQRREVLLHRRSGERHAFDVRGDVQRANRMQLQLVPLAPAQNCALPACMPLACFCADGGREKFQKCSLVFSPAPAIIAGRETSQAGGQEREGISSPVIEFPLRQWIKVSSGMGKCFRYL